MNNETTHAESEAAIAALTADNLLIALKIASADATECVAMAREAVSLSVLPEGGYERAMGVYMALLGLAGKIEVMIGDLAPEVQTIVANEALSVRNRDHSPIH